MSFIGSGALILGAGAYLQHDAAGDAADAQVKGNNASIAEQRRQFDTIMGMLQPQISTGTQALNQLGSLYGFSPSAVPGAATTAAPASPSSAPGAGGFSSVIGSVLDRIRNPNGTPGGNLSTGGANVLGRVLLNPGGSSATAGNTYTDPGMSMPGAAPGAAPSGMAGFFASPDYQFRRDEGMRDIGNFFGARGGAQSGNALRRLTEFNSNIAAGEFGNYFNRLGSLAGIGSAATSQGVGAAQNMGNNVGNLLSNSGNARASGIANRSNSLTDLFNQFGMLGGYGGFGG